MEKHTCYLCNKEIDSPREEIPIPFAEDGIVHEIWYAHQKCYENALLEIYKTERGRGRYND